MNYFGFSTYAIEDITFYHKILEKRSSGSFFTHNTFIISSYKLSNDVLKASKNANIKGVIIYTDKKTVKILKKPPTLLGICNKLVHIMLKILYTSTLQTYYKHVDLFKQFCIERAERIKVVDCFTLCSESFFTTIP